MSLRYVPVTTNDQRDRVNHLFRRYINDGSAQSLPILDRNPDSANVIAAWLVNDGEKMVGAAWAGPDLQWARRFAHRFNRLDIGEAIGKHIMMVHLIAVEPAYRGQGIATELLRRIGTVADQHQKLFLLAVIDQDLAAARPYQRLGYNVLEVGQAITVKFPQFDEFIQEGIRSGHQRWVYKALPGISQVEGPESHSGTGWADQDATARPAQVPVDEPPQQGGSAMLCRPSPSGRWSRFWEGLLRR